MFASWQQLKMRLHFTVAHVKNKATGRGLSGIALQLALLLNFSAYYLSCVL